MRQRVLGPEHPDSLAVMHNLANTLHAAGRLSEAEEMFRETLEIQRRIDGPEHSDTLLTMHNLANTLQDEKKVKEAETLYAAAMAGRHRVLGPEHPDTVKTETEFAGMLAHQNRYGEAKKIYEELIRVAKKSQDQQRLAGMWYDLACGAALAGERKEAMENLRHAIENGFSNAEQMLKDEDLRSLRGEVGFEELREEALKQGAALGAK